MVRSSKIRKFWLLVAALLVSKLLLTYQNMHKKSFILLHDHFGFFLIIKLRTNYQSISSILVSFILLNQVKMLILIRTKGYQQPYAHNSNNLKKLEFHKLIFNIQFMNHRQLITSDVLKLRK